MAGIVVARGGGPAAMGLFTVAFGAALVAAQVLAAGQPEVLIREVARGGPEVVPALLETARRIQRRILGWAVPLLLGGVAVVGGRTADLLWAMLAFAPYAVLRAQLVVATAAFKGLDRMEVEVGARAMELAVALALLVSFVPLRTPAWAPGVAFSLGSAVAVARMNRFVKEMGEGGPGSNEAVLYREGLRFLGLTVSTQLLIRADSLVQAYLGVPASALGQYGVAHTAVWSLLAVSQVLAVALYPSVSRACGDGRWGLVHVWALIVLGGGVGGLLAALLSLLRGPLVLGVFGSDYLEATALVPLLAWLLPGASAAMVGGVVLAATRRQGWLLLSQFGLVLAVLGGNLLAVPRWGLVGSAAVAVLAQTLSGLAVAGLGAVAVGKPRELAREVEL